VGLTEHQITRLWENLVAAETRALYFADLAATYTRRKQGITGTSFFLSSGAAAVILARAPAWVPLGLALAVAALQAYVMALNLDAKIAALAKLYSAWHVIATDYDQLWSHTWAEDAEDQFNRIVAREREPSELAIATAPNDESRLAKWQHRILEMHHVKMPA
jgi:hypothetical protein